MNKKKKIIKGTLSLLFSFILTFTALFSTSFANSSLNSVNNQKAMATSTKSDNYIYYGVDNKLYKVNVKTKKKTLLYKFLDPDNYIGSISVYKGYVYFDSNKGSRIDLCRPTIYRVKNNGTCAKFLSKGFNPAPYNNKIYYHKVSFEIGESNFNDKGIYRMNLTGSNKTCVKSSSNIYTFSIYKSHIYYEYDSSKSCYSYIYKMSTSGKSNTKLLSYYNFGDDPLPITLDALYNGYLYFSKNSSSYKYKLLSHKITKLPYVKGVVIDVTGGYLYGWDCTLNQKALYKVNFSTHNRTNLVSDVIEPGVISRNYVYYEVRVPGNTYDVRSYIMKNNGTNKIYLDRFEVPAYGI